MTLEQQLVALMDQHGLTYLSLAVHTLEDGTRFMGASAHAPGVVGGNNGWGTAMSAVEVINSAIADVNAKRAAPVIEALNPMVEAA